MLKFFDFCGYVGILGVGFFLLPTAWLTQLGCTGTVSFIGTLCAVFFLGVPTFFKPTKVTSEPGTR
ncbi:MAG: hypothetical protein WCV85_01070 [Patescibacteria group bacterium]|jgi:hypothetical protein